YSSRTHRPRLEEGRAQTLLTASSFRRGRRHWVACSHPISLTHIHTPRAAQPQVSAASLSFSALVHPRADKTPLSLLSHVPTDARAHSPAIIRTRPPVH
ncbi:hypothetical protein GQ607_016281, partial [Colletotrichum asianum]